MFSGSPIPAAVSQYLTLGLSAEYCCLKPLTFVEYPKFSSLTSFFFHGIRIIVFRSEIVEVRLRNSCPTVNNLLKRDPFLFPLKLKCLSFGIDAHGLISGNFV